MSDRQPPAELLEEMLKQGEAEFFPKFTRHLLRFIDTFNHRKIQDISCKYLDELDGKLAVIQEAESVFDMLRSFREFLHFFEREFGPVRLFKRLQESGFFALVNDERFNFLKESISVEESASRLLSLTEEGLRLEAPTSLNRAFEEYVQSWSENRRESARRKHLDMEKEEVSIGKETAKMRAEKAEADRFTDNDIQRIIDDVLKYFEPLRVKLCRYVAFRPAVVLAKETVDIAKKTVDIANSTVSAVYKGTIAVVKTAFGSPEKQRLDVHMSTPKIYSNLYGLPAANGALAIGDDEDEGCDPCDFTYLVDANEIRDSNLFPAAASEATFTGNGELNTYVTPLIGKSQGNQTNCTRQSAIGKADRRLRHGWYESIVDYITSFLHDAKTEEELRSFLEEECLEDDVDKFRDCFDRWLKRIRTGASGRNSLLISKDVALAEIERVKEFIYAVTLNQPERIRRHNEMTESLLNTAVSGSTPDDHESPRRSYLPFVSFGQLPLPSPANRIVRFTFVVGSNQVTANSEVDDILTELKLIFKGTRTHSREMRSDKLLLHLDVDVDINLPLFIAQNIVRLSDLSIRAVLVGSFGLGGFRHAMRPEFNRIYGTESAEGFRTTRFTSPLKYGNEPYFCPMGWRRYSINVGLSAEEFERTYGDWPVAYHGSAGHLANTILQEGLQASGQGVFLQDGQGRVYVSPSIEYSGHPRYAKVWKVGEGRYVQMVLQLRVQKRLIFFKKPGTLPGAFEHDAAMDPNFKDNRELEWIIRWPPGKCVNAVQGIVVYGLMLRVTAEHPGRLPQCAWWR